MRPRAPLPWTWQAYLLGAVALRCQHEAVYRDDPLAASQKAVQGKVTQTAAPLLIAQAEPSTPLLSPTALAKLAPLPRYPAPAELALNPAAPDAATPRPLATLPRAPLPAVPVAREKRPGPVPAIPAVRRRALATYAHAPDYSWLQGVLSRDGRGGWRLQYPDPGHSDLGPVPVEADEESAFAMLRPGDVVIVQGEITGGTPPRYRVHAVRLAERPAP